MSAPAAPAPAAALRCARALASAASHGATAAGATATPPAAPPPRSAAPPSARVAPASARPEAPATWIAARGGGQPWVEVAAAQAPIVLGVSADDTRRSIASRLTASDPSAG
ncbi:MAG: hypothetical protein U1F43_37910 [Myxococcota bacterium]